MKSQLTPQISEAVRKVLSKAEFSLQSLGAAIVRAHFSEFNEQIELGQTFASLSSLFKEEGIDISARALSYHIKRERARRAGNRGNEKFLTAAAQIPQPPAQPGISITAPTPPVEATPAPAAPMMQTYAPAAPAVAAIPATVAMPSTPRADKFSGPAVSSETKRESLQHLANIDLPPEILKYRYFNLPDGTQFDLINDRITPFIPLYIKYRPDAKLEVLESEKRDLIIQTRIYKEFCLCYSEFSSKSNRWLKKQEQLSE